MISKSTIFLIINIIFTANGQDESGYCAKPVVESENIVDVKFIHENYKQGWNTQFGNSVWQKRMTKLLQGENKPDATEGSDICLRTSMDFRDEHHIVGYVSGFGGLMAQWNCSDMNHIYDCTFYSTKNGYKDSAKAYMVYFDGNEAHNSVGTAFCYADGTVGWSVSSISKTLKDEETKVILDRLKSVGFNPSARVPLRSENCP